MRVLLLLSNFLDGENRIFEGYLKGIKDNSKEFFHLDYFRHYLELGRHGLEEKIENLLVEKRIDCVFFVLFSGDLTFDVAFIKRIGSMATIVMNFFDSPQFFETIDRYYAQVADLVILPDYLIKFNFELLNINAVCTFSLFDKNVYCKAGSSDLPIDVSFVGDISRRGRAKHLQELRRRGIPVSIYGCGSSNGFLNFSDMLAVFQGSKINLNFTGISEAEKNLFGRKINNRINICNGRAIEIAMCGGFVLSEYAPGMEKMFEIGNEIDVFRTPDELCAKISYYLSHDSERRAIAEKGHQRAWKDYDSTSGFMKVFSTIKNLSCSRKTLLLDTEFLQNYSAFRFFFLPSFIFNLKPRLFLDEVKTIFSTRFFSLWKSICFFYKGVGLFFRMNPTSKAKAKMILGFQK